MKPLDEMVCDVLTQAAADAERERLILEARAAHSVTGVQARVAQDKGARVIRAGNELMVLVSGWAQKNELTPGEAALILSSAVYGVLEMLPGMSSGLARAIAIEFARGPKAE